MHESNTYLKANIGLGRNLLRPLFIKNRVHDFDIFERHTHKLMSLIGGKGEIVDVSDLFYRSVNRVRTSSLYTNV